MTTRIHHRITSLERWGMRVNADFQPEAVASIRDARFTGVLIRYVNALYAALTAAKPDFKFTATLYSV